MGILDLGRYKGIVFAITGFLLFMAIILAVNHGKAGRFADDVTGVNFLSQQQEQPRAIRDNVFALTERLKAGQKIDDAIEALRNSASVYDHALGGLADGGMI